MNSLVVPKGLEGVIVDRTEISTTDQSGSLLYRGYRVVDLVEKLDFESVALLVLMGKIPDPEARSRFSDLLKANSVIEGKVREIIRVLREPNIMNNLRSIVSLYPYKNRKNLDLLIEIASKFPSIIFYSDVAIRGWRDIEETGGTYAERLYRILTGRDDRENSKFFEKLLIMYMEHEFNSSTFALRVTASTLADPVCGITSALSALKGPLHGGANSEVLDYLLKFKSEDEAIRFIENKLSRKEKIMGFGHRVYKVKDPRAQYIKSQLKKLHGYNSVMKYAESIESYMWQERHIPVNLDFYGALYMNALGIEERFFLPVFASARVFGWSAHYIEQVSSNKIIRPQAQYVGPVGLKL